MAHSAQHVVVGAGPAGLMAAYQLAIRGHEVVVLERGSHPGGLAASFDVAGVLVDHGSHRLHPSTDPRIMALLKHLLGTDLQRRSRNGRIRIDGRWLRFPLRPFDLLAHTRPGLAARLGRDLIGARAARTPSTAEPATFAEAVRVRLGPTMLDELYGPYAWKLWGLGPDELHPELARRRIATPSGRALFTRVVAAARPGREAPAFWYPRRGFGQICERLAEAATEAGARLVFDAEITGVHLGADPGPLTGSSTGSSTGVRLDGVNAPLAMGAQLWSTIPLTTLARLLRTPEVPRAVSDAASSLRSRAMTFVYLVLDQPRFSEFDAHYLPGPGSRASRISEPRNYRDSPSDPLATTVLCAEIPCAVGDETWTASADDLAGHIVDEIGRTGLGSIRPVEVAVKRAPSVYPIYDLAYPQALAQIEHWITGLANVVSFGRQGLFAHDNSHHAMTSGWAAVDALDHTGRIDPVRWNAAQRSFASHVVDD